MGDDSTLLRRHIVESVARLAFERFKHGLASGEWTGLLDMLTDDCILRIPKGRFAGTHHGKAKAAEFFSFIRQTYPDGLFVTDVLNVGISTHSILFEYAAKGELSGTAYQEMAVLVFEVRGDKISAYREYFGAE